MCIFGLVMIYSASSASTILRYYVAPNHFFIRQLLVLVVGFIFGFFVTLFPTNRYKFLTYLYSLFVLVLLMYVLVKGKIAGNAQSWIAIFSQVNLQNLL